MNRSEEEREQREVSKTAIKMGFARKTLFVNQHLEVLSIASTRERTRAKHVFT